MDDGALPVLTDFCLNVGGILLATTLYASAPTLLLTLLLAPCLWVIVSTRSKVSSRRSRNSPQNGSAGSGEDGAKEGLSEFPIRPYLTAYRGAMMIVTCHAILAVDFRVFPRRFAKVETWGTSVMDMGVGSFVYSAGLVTAKSYIKDKRGELTAMSKKSLMQIVLAAVRSALPLFVLGVVRLVSVKNLKYAEHVTEYGIHWNFFFTLALLPLALLFLQPLFSSLPGPVHGYVGLSLALAYELVLQTTSLKAWALTAPRENLLAKNREGAVSWVGYLAIFLLGMETGGAVLPRAPSRNGVLSRIHHGLGLAKDVASSRGSRAQLLIALALSSALYVGLLLPFFYPALFPVLSIPVSRRLANAPYVLWVAAFNTTQVLLFALVETVVFPNVYLASTADAEKRATKQATSRILADFNAGGLLLFLAANLGTGAVNLSIKTLDVPNAAAVGVLIAYMAVLTALARVLRVWKIKV